MASSKTTGPIAGIPSGILNIIALMALLVSGCLGDHEEHGNHVDSPSSVAIPGIPSTALFVVNGSSSSLTVIDTKSELVLGTIALKNAAYPHHGSLSPDRSLIALGIPGADLSGGHAGGHGGHGSAGAILLMDASTGATRTARKLDNANHNAAFSPDGKEIWTAQTSSPGSILVLDAATLAIRRTIEAGLLPAEVTFSIDGKYAFSANGGSNDVTVIDAAAKAVVKTIKVGSNPVGAWTGADGIMYVDNEASRSITAIHGTDLETIRTYALGFTPGMAATGPDGKLWVTDSDNGKVVIFASGSAARSGEIVTGAGAHGIAFGRDGKTAYVTNQTAGTVSIIDVDGVSVRKNVNVGSKPNGLILRD